MSFASRLQLRHVLAVKTQPLVMSVPVHVLSGVVMKTAPSVVSSAGSADEAPPLLRVVPAIALGPLVPPNPVCPPRESLLVSVVPPPLTLPRVEAPLVPAARCNSIRSSPSIPLQPASPSNQQAECCLEPGPSRNRQYVDATNRVLPEQPPLRNLTGRYPFTSFERSEHARTSLPPKRDHGNPRCT